MPRFVLLYHDCPPQYARPSHWDLMLESGDSLRTWALERLPRSWHAAHARTVERYPQCAMLAEDQEVSAEQLGDHRREYLDLEGDLGGDRGRVIRVASGVYTTVTESPLCWQLAMTDSSAARQFCLSRTSAENVRWSLALLD